jgi:CheY-like chemotaxis protein
MLADTGRVLVVDDERAILDLVVAVLSSRGYEAVAVESGAAALARLMERANEIDLLATDINMPAMSGPELVSRVLVRRPDLPILFMTGYSPDNKLPDQYIKQYPILHKPFTADELVAAVRGALNRHRV